MRSSRRSSASPVLRVQPAHREALADETLRPTGDAPAPRTLRASLRTRSRRVRAAALGKNGIERSACRLRRLPKNVERPGSGFAELEERGIEGMGERRAHEAGAARGSDERQPGDTELDAGAPFHDACLRNGPTGGLSPTAVDVHHVELLQPGEAAGQALLRALAQHGAGQRRTHLVERREARRQPVLHPHEVQPIGRRERPRPCAGREHQRLARRSAGRTGRPAASGCTPAAGHRAERDRKAPRPAPPARRRSGAVPASARVRRELAPRGVSSRKTWVNVMRSGCSSSSRRRSR